MGVLAVVAMFASAISLGFGFERTPTKAGKWAFGLLAMIVGLSAAVYAFALYLDAGFGIGA